MIIDNRRQIWNLKTTVCMAIAMTIVLPLFAVIDSSVKRLDTISGKTMFRPQLLCVQDNGVLLAQSKAIRNATSARSGISPQTFDACVDIATLKTDTAEVVWQQSDVRLSQIPDLGSVWSVSASEGNNSISILFNDLWTTGEMLALMEIDRKQKDLPYSIGELTRRIGVQGEIPANVWVAHCVAYISPTQVVAVAVDNFNNLWRTHKSDSGSCSQWERFAAGSYPQIVVSGGVATLYYLQTKEQVGDRGGNRNLVSVHYKGCTPIIGSMMPIGHLPETKFSACNIDSTGTCIMYLSDNVPYLILGDEPGGRWSSPQQVVFSNKLDLATSVSVSSWKGDVFFVVGTESGKLYIGKIPGKLLTTIPKNKLTPDVIQAPVPLHRGVLAANSKASVDERIVAMDSIASSMDATEVEHLIAHMDAKYDYVLREKAIVTLASIGGKSAVSAMIKLLEKSVEEGITEGKSDQVNISWCAIDALSFIGDASALPILEKLIHSSDINSNLRRRAESALKKSKRGHRD